MLVWVRSLIDAVLKGLVGVIVGMLYWRLNQFILKYVWSKTLKREGGGKFILS